MVERRKKIVIVRVCLQERFVGFGVMMHQRGCAVQFVGNFAECPAALMQNCRKRNAHIHQFSRTHLRANPAATRFRRGKSQRQTDMRVIQHISGV